jgi:hypothetical protein
MKRIKRNKTTNTSPNYKFPVGMQVTIVEPGYTYPTYRDKFEELEFTNTVENLGFPRGTTCTIFARIEHESNGKLLYALSMPDSERQCLISEDGVTELVRSKHTTKKLEFIEIRPALSLCHWNHESQILHINAETLNIRHGSFENDVVLRVRNEETGGYGDFVPFAHNVDHTVYQGLGIPVTLLCYWLEKSFVHRTRKTVV